MVENTAQTPPTQTPPTQTPPATPPAQPTQPAQSAQTPPPPPPTGSTQQANAATPPPANKKGFPKATIILIVILGAVAGILVYFALSQGTKPKPKETAVAPTPTPYAQSVLSFEQSNEPATGTPGATLTPSPKSAKVLTYNVVLTTNANMINAVQLELGFDQQVVKIDDITPGKFLANPVQLTKDVNNKTGRISYALGIGPNDKPIQGTGVVAVITLEIIPGSSATSTKLSFLPKTLIAGAGVNPSVLKSSTDITIPITQPTLTGTGLTPTEEVTPEVSPTATQ